MYFIAVCLLNPPRNKQSWLKCICWERKMPYWSFFEVSLTRLLWVFGYFYLILVKACTHMSKVLKMKFCRLFPDVEDRKIPRFWLHILWSPEAGRLPVSPQSMGFILMLVPFMVNSFLSTVAVENICVFVDGWKERGETPPQTWTTTLSFSLMANWNHESTPAPITVTEEFHAQINWKSVLGVGLGSPLWDGQLPSPSRELAAGKAQLPPFCIHHFICSKVMLL